MRNKIFIILTISIFFISMVSAVWYNPLTWFSASSEDVGINQDNINTNITKESENDFYKIENKLLNTKDGIKSQIDDNGKVSISKFESNFDIEKPIDFGFTFYNDTDKNKINFKTADGDELNYYFKILNNSERALEYEIILNKKLQNNIITIPINYTNIEFYYQKPLYLEYGMKESTEECNSTDCNGNHRPENVINSYAAYSNNKNNEYNSGKLFHIYRPWVEDSEGSREWADLNISNNIINIIINSSWLEKAKYPILVDPTFGYTSIGSTSYTLCRGLFSNVDDRRGTSWSMPENGTADSISLYISSGTISTGHIKTFINQKDSVGSNSHGQIATKENSPVSNSAHWETFILNNETLISGNNYIISAICDNSQMGFGGDYRTNGDSGPGNTSYYETNTYASPESPWNVSPEGSPILYSMYVNYTADAPANPQISIENIYPTGEVNVTQNTFFNVTLNVTCLSGTCGTVNVSLDPTIKLQTADTENLDDTYDVSNNPDLNRGSLEFMYVDLFDSKTYIKFNISSIPSGATITNASLFLTCNDGASIGWDANEWIVVNANHLYQYPIYNISNYEWNESVLTYNNGRPTTSQYNTTPEDSVNITYANQITNEDTMEWDVTNAVTQDYNSGYNNVSFYLNLDSKTAPTALFNSKEYTTDSTLRPYLNVTYLLGSSVKSGLIPVQADWTTEPFYTNASSNPLTTSSLSAGQSELVTFWVNATGTVGVKHDFFAFANATSNLTISNTTSHWNVTIVEAEAADTCNPTSPLSSDYVFDCSDNCVQSTALSTAYDISFVNSGTFTLTSSIDFTSSGQKVLVWSGCEIRIEGGGGFV